MLHYRWGTLLAQDCSGLHRILGMNCLQQVGLLELFLA